jgi:hypothetical protein
MAHSSVATHQARRTLLALKAHIAKAQYSAKDSCVAASTACGFGRGSARARLAQHRAAKP